MFLLKKLYLGKRFFFMVYFLVIFWLFLEYINCMSIFHGFYVPVNLSLIIE